MVTGWLVMGDRPWVYLGPPQKHEIVRSTASIGTETMVWKHEVSQSFTAYILAIQSDEGVEFKTLNSVTTLVPGDSLAIRMSRPFNP